MEKNIIGQPQLFMPESFNECMTYYEQLNYLFNKIMMLEERVTQLEGVKENDETNINNA